MSEPPFLLHSGARSMPDAGERPTGLKLRKIPRIRRAGTRRRGHAPATGQERPGKEAPRSAQHDANPVGAPVAGQAESFGPGSDGEAVELPPRHATGDAVRVLHLDDVDRRVI